MHLESRQNDRGVDVVIESAGSRWRRRGVDDIRTGLSLSTQPYNLRWKGVIITIDSSKWMRPQYGDVQVSTIVGRSLVRLATRWVNRNRITLSQQCGTDMRAVLCRSVSFTHDKCFDGSNCIQRCMVNANLRVCGGIFNTPVEML